MRGSKETGDLGIMLTSCTSLNILLLGVDPGYPQGAPLRINCVGVPLVGTLKSLLLPASFTI
jgi:hypothetical protein